MLLPYLKTNGANIHFTKSKSARVLMQVLHRKTEEAAAATKRLKELLEARKSSKDNTTTGITGA